MPEMTSEVWQTISSVLENFRVCTVQGEGPTDESDLALALQQRGWDLAERHPLSSSDFRGWPPGDAPFLIELTPAEWRFVATRVDAGIAITRQILAETDLHPSVRAEQEASLDGELRAQETLRALGYITPE